MKKLIIAVAVLCAGCESVQNKCNWERCVVINKAEREERNGKNRETIYYWDCRGGTDMRASSQDYWDYSKTGDTVDIWTDCIQRRLGCFR